MVTKLYLQRQRICSQSRSDAFLFTANLASIFFGSTLNFAPLIKLTGSKKDNLLKYQANDRLISPRSYNLDQWILNLVVQLGGPLDEVFSLKEANREWKIYAFPCRRSFPPKVQYRAQHQPQEIPPMRNQDYFLIPDEQAEYFKERRYEEFKT